MLCAMSERDYTVRVIDLPPGVPALVARDETGFYNIYLNARASQEQQKKALRHELAHIVRRHFEDDRPTAVIEEEADGGTEKRS